MVFRPRFKRRFKRTVPIRSARYSARMRRVIRSKFKKRVAVARRKPEAGFVDLAYSSHVTDTTGEIFLVATIAQGASHSQRVGKRVLYKSMQIRGSWVSGTSVGSAPHQAMMLIYDKRPHGTLPAITDVLNSATPQSFLNDINSDQYMVLKRWDVVTMGDSDTPVTGEERKPINDYIDLKGLPVQYKGLGTGAIGDIEYGGLYLITVGTEAVGTTAGTVLVGCRTRYVDP